MKIKTATIKEYADSEAPLPPTFTTGYKRDLDIARQIVRTRSTDGTGDTEAVDADERRDLPVSRRLLPV